MDNDSFAGSRPIASKGEAVILHGQLKGNSQTIPCAVGAVIAFRHGRYEYAHLRIYDVPPDLPDGSYKLAFEGRTVAVQRENRVWITRP